MILNTSKERLYRMNGIVPYKFKGKVLMLGLGNGFCVINQGDKMEELTVIENDKSLIKRFSEEAKKFPNVKVIHADAHTWEAPKEAYYDTIFLDIWYHKHDQMKDLETLVKKYSPFTRNLIYLEEFSL